jgi:hypothetical protein
LSRAFALIRNLPTVALQRLPQVLGLVRETPSVVVGRSPFKIAAVRAYVGPIVITMTDVPQSPSATATLTLHGPVTITKAASLTVPATFAFDFAAGDLDVPGTYLLELSVVDGLLTNTAHGTLAVQGRTP